MTKSNSTYKGRVIIPYGRSIMALVAAHSLGQRGIEVIGCDSIDFTILSFSKYVRDYFIYPDPEKDKDAFIEAMIEKIKELKPEDDRPYVLMPVFKDTRLFAEYKARFSPHITVAAPDHDAICKLHPKQNFAETTEALDISAPKTWMPESREGLEAVAGDLPYPVIIKPYDQAGGRGIHKVEDKGVLLDYWDENQKQYGQKSLVQDIAPGTDYCLTALYDHGARKASMAYKNVHRFPRESGAGIMRETVEDERFAKIADDLMGPLKWNGVAEFDFLWDEDEDSTPVMIEVNTRFWGGLFQSVESGIDYPWLLYKLMVEGSIDEASEPKIGTRTKVPYIWLISALQDVFDNDERMAEIEAHGKEALEKMRNSESWDETWAGLKGYAEFLGDYLGETFNFSDRARKVKHILESGKTARNELLDSDDPMAAFGVLFVLGSLMRHGELPPEVSH